MTICRNPKTKMPANKRAMDSGDLPVKLGLERPDSVPFRRGVQALPRCPLAKTVE